MEKIAHPGVLVANDAFADAEKHWSRELDFKRIGTTISSKDGGFKPAANLLFPPKQLKKLSQKQYNEPWRHKCLYVPPELKHQQVRRFSSCYPRRESSDYAQSQLCH